MKLVLVPTMLLASGAFMAIAWLGHLRIQEHGFWVALAMSWAIVLPEYMLNVFATRLGYGTFSGGQMAAIHLASGVVCVTLVSRLVPHERMALQQWAGFAMLGAGIMLLMWRN